MDDTQKYTIVDRGRVVKNPLSNKSFSLTFKELQKNFGVTEHDTRKQAKEKIMRAINSQKGKDISYRDFMAGKSIGGNSILKGTTLDIVRQMLEQVPEVSHPINKISNFFKNFTLKKNGNNISDEEYFKIDSKYHLRSYSSAHLHDKLAYNVAIYWFVKAGKEYKIKLLNPAECDDFTIKDGEVVSFKWSNKSTGEIALIDENFLIFSNPDSRDNLFGTPPLAKFFTKLSLLIAEEDDAILYYGNGARYSIVFTLKDGATQEQAEALKADNQQKKTQDGRYTDAFMSGVEDVHIIDQAPKKLMSMEDKEYIKKLLYEEYNIPVELMGFGTGPSASGVEKYALLNANFKQDRIEPTRVEHTLEMQTVINKLVELNKDPLLENAQVSFSDFDTESKYLKRQGLLAEFKAGIISQEQYIKLLYGDNFIASRVTETDAPADGQTIDGTATPVLDDVPSGIDDPSLPLNQINQRNLRKLQKSILRMDNLKEKKQSKKEVEGWIELAEKEKAKTPQDILSQTSAFTKLEDIFTNALTNQKESKKPLYEELKKDAKDVFKILNKFSRFGFDLAKKEMVDFGNAPIPEKILSKVKDLNNFFINKRLSATLGADIAKEKDSLEDALTDYYDSITQATDENEDDVAWLLSMLTLYANGQSVDTTTKNLKPDFDVRKRAKQIVLPLALSVFNVAYQTIYKPTGVKQKGWKHSTAENPRVSHEFTVGQIVDAKKRFKHGDGSTSFWSGEKPNCQCHAYYLFNKKIENWDNVLMKS